MKAKELLEDIETLEKVAEDELAKGPPIFVQQKLHSVRGKCKVLKELAKILSSEKTIEEFLKDEMQALADELGSLIKISAAKLKQS
ncbi:MAG: hypothetical protein HY929_07130 [Euryarchaeota archaeon]|nr:hypothetical protein [Euryarchaeota archaeon]